MDVICGAGVVGGSLVHHGMTVRPTEAAFTACMPGVLDLVVQDPASPCAGCRPTT